MKMVVVVVVMRVDVTRMGMLAVQHRLAGVHLSYGLRPVVAAVPEAREGTVVHGVDVLAVGDAGHRIVIPVEVAGLDRRFEAGEDF